jgi:hypothetical protein
MRGTIFAIWRMTNSIRPFRALVPICPQSYSLLVQKPVAKTLSALPLAPQVMGQYSGYPRGVTGNLGNLGKLRSLFILKAWPTYGHTLPGEANFYPKLAIMSTIIQLRQWPLTSWKQTLCSLGKPPVRGPSASSLCYVRQSALSPPVMPDNAYYRRHTMQQSGGCAHAHERL